MSEAYDLVIEPNRTIRHYWRDLWRYRELFLFMAWRDILVRYKQTALGLAWSILRPLLILLVFTVLFGKLARFPSEGGAPYPVLVLAALLPWQLFANALADSSSSLVLNAGMISKVYFPRIIIPASTVIVSLVDFLIASTLLAGVMVWYQYLPGWRLLLLPLFVALALLAAMGAGLWMAALNVRYRDVRYLVPFLVQFGLYVSPVGFSSSIIPEQWRLLYALNPMVGVIDGFRWALLGGDSFDAGGCALSLLVCLAFFLSGLAYFRRAERTFADVI